LVQSALTLAKMRAARGGERLFLVYRCALATAAELDAE
jgi:hypothetical protein